MDTHKIQNDLRFELISDTSEASTEDPIQFVRRKLRGRYRVTILLAMLLALCGAIIGFVAAPVRYESAGYIQFKPTLPTILYKSEENQYRPQYDSFVTAQVTMIQSRDILEMALLDPNLVKIDWPTGTEGVEALERMLSVTHKRGEQVISVSATHRDAAKAQYAVNAVLNAYDSNYNDPSLLNPTIREQKLVKRIEQLQVELAKINEQVLDVSDQYGADTISRLHQEKIQELIAVDQKLSELSLSISALQLQNTKLAEGLPIDGPVGLDSMTGFFATNETGPLAELHQQEQTLLIELEGLGDRFRERHPKIRDLNRRLDAIRRHIEIRRNSYGGMVALVDGVADERLILASASLKRLQDIEKQFITRRQQLREEATHFGNKHVALGHLAEQAKTFKIRLTDTRHALDVLRVESDRDESARIVTSLGDQPTVPVTDRRQPLAVASGLFG
ncbi:MAG: hypothetical protein O7G85_08915, partial [Planctomycetota bacterium]|nr:hypothetical protein [Planctomycetota bacterium]